jgi:hypothetical protein
MAEVSGPRDGPTGWGLSRLWHEFSTFLLYVFWVLALLAVPLVYVFVDIGRLSAAAAVVGLGLLAPLVAWAIGAHLERVAGGQERRWWWRYTQWPHRLRSAPLDQAGWDRWQRASSIAVAVGSLTIAWTVYAGSVVTAVLVPVAVWVVVFARLRRSAPWP